MLKKLKPLKQILFEYKNKGYKIDQYDKSSQINIDGGSKEKNYTIAVSMLKYFRTEINVYVAGKESNKYEYYMKTLYNRWWFREDWFLPEVELLDDKLFEL